MAPQTCARFQAGLVSWSRRPAGSSIISTPGSTRLNAVEFLVLDEVTKC